MRFIAKTTTADGRLTSGIVYRGMLVVLRTVKDRLAPARDELRIAVYDNKKEWMTFATSAFMPAEPHERPWHPFEISTTSGEPPPERPQVLGSLRTMSSGFNPADPDEGEV